ncbi:hypothetical protein KRX51_03950 [Corynebacterium sp. TAE3-ERU12]|uniref:glycine betaine ABC transporter substrate-binding protein n=1 Tax=Corynebacterium sp. TAE3-ERU12 TaxID=2849491 RepID=UPI001C44FEEC|nr:glycine betaine ABC transporter substrate-binding protein [Corynebacterium sp. TAE3-ERU12]MBV7295071.1 hypothetical protein [Corynebacterium sp. TAE3-ERU12]
MEILRHRRNCTTAAVIAILSATGALSACAAQEPAPTQPQSQRDPVVVATGDSPEQQVLAEVYAQAFARTHREGIIAQPIAAAERLNAVRTGAATVSFGCTGELLAQLNPQRAAQLHQRYAADDDPGKELSAKWRDEVYAEFSQSLPGDVMATDPSNALACNWLPKAQREYLPQHLVPFYAKPALDRRDRVQVLNRVAGSISTVEVSQLDRRVQSGADPAEVAEQWLTTSRFSTG